MFYEAKGVFWFREYVYRLKIWRKRKTQQKQQTGYKYQNSKVSMQKRKKIMQNWKSIFKYGEITGKRKKKIQTKIEMTSKKRSVDKKKIKKKGIWPLQMGNWKSENYRVWESEREWTTEKKRIEIKAVEEEEVQSVL